MRNLLNPIIEEIAGPIVLFDESFSNETIPDKNLSNSRFYKCEFKNIVFDTVIFRKSEFSQCKCRFQNCQILGSDLTRVEFGNTNFTSCEFKQVELSGSLFTNAQFSETKFEKILLIGSILFGLKIKTTTYKLLVVLEFIS